MRLWSIHPQFLDSKGLVALWREGLLARKVLLGETKGYRHHPQLKRFQETGRFAIERVDTYLHVVCDEAERRYYNFDRTKLGVRTDLGCMQVTEGQLAFEYEHLKVKVLNRTGVLLDTRSMKHHPMFIVVQGGKADWEKA